MLKKLALPFVLSVFSYTGNAAINVDIVNFKPNACTINQSPDDLKMKFLENTYNLDSEKIQCSRDNINGKWIYSILTNGFDINNDGEDDLFTFKLQVSAFKNSDVNYQEVSNSSSMGLGELFSLQDNSDNNWVVDGRFISNKETIKFEVYDIKTSLSGFFIQKERFSTATLVEPDNGYGHKYVIGLGNNLASGEFQTPTKEISIDSNPAYITGAGSSTGKRTIALGNIQIRFAIAKEGESPLSDYSSYPSGNTFDFPYPEQDRTSTIYPSFSWETVPRWLAVRKATAFSNDEVNIIANNYNIVMLEKSNKQGLDTVDAGILNAANRLKDISSNITTLYYFNARVHYTGYSSDQEYEDNAWDWSTKKIDENGVESIYYFKDRYYWHNFASLGMRDWWARSVIDVVSNPQIDGLFIDAIAKTPSESFEEPLFLNDKPNTDFAKLADDVAKRLPQNKLFIGNTLRAEKNNANRNHMRYQDGSYLERWTVPYSGSQPKMSEADAITMSIQLMREALSKGKIIMFQSSPETDEPVPELLEDKKVYMQKHVTFPLAVYLIAAEENAYFSYQLGVSADERVQNIWDSSFIPELSRPLGKPISSPIQNGYIFERSFEHVDVWLDVEHKNAKLTWK
ncbi:putative glycoside hydrolase [Photobacterium damselae]|uniref:putative glycoside hydrolase n=1 Tax=Photobacterium damselae TaxID=38293 RepID=UPI001302E336|nr:putative glycoside hydrolase [Photobacterium damselae]